MRNFVAIVLVLVSFVPCIFAADGAHAGHDSFSAAEYMAMKERAEKAEAALAASPLPPDMAGTTNPTTKTDTSSKPWAEDMKKLSDEVVLLGNKVDKAMSAIVTVCNRFDDRIKALETLAQAPLVKELPAAGSVPVTVNGKAVGSASIQNGSLAAHIPIDADTREVCIKIKKKGDKSGCGGHGGGGGGGRRSAPAPKPDFEVASGVEGWGGGSKGISINNVNGGGTANSGFVSGGAQQPITYSAPPPAPVTYSAPPPQQYYQPPVYQQPMYSGGFGGFQGGFGGYRGGFRGGFRGGWQGGGHHGGFHGGYRLGPVVTPLPGVVAPRPSTPIPGRRGRGF